MIKKYYIKINDKLEQICNYNRIKKLFLILLPLSLLFLFIIIVSRGRFGLQIFCKGDDTFMDFFNVLVMNYGDDPIPKSIYPPFSALFMYPFYYLIPSEFYADMSGLTLKLSEIGMLSFLLFITIAIVSIYNLLKITLKGTDIYKRIAIICMMLSSPFLFTIERGNTILYALIFSFIFVFYHTHENKYLKEFALLSLAIAAGLKIYPAILGILLINKHYYKEALRTIIYGVIIFIFPFFIFGGLGKLNDLFNNILSTSTEFYDRGFGYKVDLMNFIRIIYYFLGLNESNLIDNGIIVTCSVFVFGLVSYAFIDDNWKKILLLSCIMILSPSFNYTYALIYLIIPLTSFLNECKTRGVKDYFYVFIFIIIFNPVYLTTFNSTLEYIYPLTINSFLQNFGVVLLYICLILEGYANLINKIKRGNRYDIISK